MRKLSILSLSLLLLASCGGSSNWDKETKSQMESSIGIVLPYIKLDNIELNHDTNIFQIYGEGDNDDLISYQKLLEKDFTYLSTKKDLYGDPMLSYESKNLDRPVRIEMQTYPEEIEEGIEKDYFSVTAYRYISWPTAEIEALGITDAPQYAGENKLGAYKEVSDNLGDYIVVNVFEGSSESYTATLEAANFITGNYGDNDDWDGAFDYLDFAYNETTNTFIQYYENGELGLIIRIFIYDYNPA